MERTHRGTFRCVVACVGSTAALLAACAADPEVADGGGSGGGGSGGAPSRFGNSDAEIGALDGSIASDDGGTAPLPAFRSCAGGEGCGEGLACRYERCIPRPTACTTGNDCFQDSYCDVQGECIPFGVPPEVDRDPTCRTEIELGALRPSVQCRWEGPPAGDPKPTHDQSMATPVVVDFDFDDNPRTLHPSIVFPTFYGPEEALGTGTMRVVDGGDCSHQFTLSPEVQQSAPAALGDLDGDGRAEIVAVKASGGIVAWRYDAASKGFEVMLESADSTGGIYKWSGVALHDLDDDGTPEIVYGAVVYDTTGAILDGSLGFPLGSQGTDDATALGYIPVVADVDEDGKLELVQGNAIHEWSAATKKWVAEPYFAAGALGVGQVAVADFGEHPIAALDGRDVAEIVVIHAGTARVQRVDGSVIEVIDIPGTGRGGPPTVADFDGDGRAEFASANGDAYVVFDLDCTEAGSACEAEGVRWSRPSRDLSSNATGSSVFDFDANGAAEAVYADECFLRIYDGATGTVLYSAGRPSATGYENPVIADVDGDFNTEIVSSVNDTVSASCPELDDLFPTTTFESHKGVVVLRDVEDRWAASRPIWNQHPYAVTHVDDGGAIPRSSEVEINWRAADLNNFRQNVQGDLEADGRPDLTVSGETREVLCEDSVAALEAKICNRGTKPMASGTDVSFRDGGESGPELCAIPIPEILEVGACTRVSCEAVFDADGIEMTVVVDPQGESAECWEGNNVGFFREVKCGLPPVADLPFPE